MSWKRALMPFVAGARHMRYLGLHLTVGALLLIGASWLFGGIAQGVVAGDPLTAVDQNVADWFHERRTPGLTTTMLLVSSLASFAWVTAVDTLRRRPR